MYLCSIMHIHLRTKLMDNLVNILPIWLTTRRTSCVRFIMIVYAAAYSLKTVLFLLPFNTIYTLTEKGHRTNLCLQHCVNGTKHIILGIVYR